LIHLPLEIGNDVRRRSPSQIEVVGGLRGEVAQVMAVNYRAVHIQDPKTARLIVRDRHMLPCIRVEHARRADQCMSSTKSINNVGEQISRPSLPFEPRLTNP